MDNHVVVNALLFLLVIQVFKLVLNIGSNWIATSSGKNIEIMDKSGQYNQRIINP